MAHYNLTLIQKGADRKTTLRLTVTGFPPVQVEGSAPVYRNLTLSLGSIDPKNWNETTSRPTKAFSNATGYILHKEIDETLAAVTKAFNECPAPKTVDAVRDLYNTIRGKVKKGTVIQKKRTLFLDIVDRWIAEAEKEGTRHTYEGFRKKVVAYEKAKKCGLIDLLQWKTEDAEAFHTWITKTYDHSANTAAGMRKCINKAIHEARKDGATLSPIQGWGFITPEKDVLEWAELKKVIDYTPRTASEADYQTLLVTYALTSIRISDTWKFYDGIKVAGGVLHSHFKVTKTPSPTVYPVVFEPVRALIEKNGIPAKRSEYHIRKGIHALIKRVGIEKHVEVHSLRRAFVTNFLALGNIPDYLLARVFTGHKINKERGIFFAYNHASIAMDHRTVLTLIQMVPPEFVGGVQLLSPEVYAGLGTIPLYPVRDAV